MTKSREGRLDEIDYCVGCDQGCLDGFANVDCPHITCLRNPAVGREKECRIIRTDKPETVLIAGGGIAGLEAAIILKERGHLPVLCESSDVLGGQFLTAGEAPRKYYEDKKMLFRKKKKKREQVTLLVCTGERKIVMKQGYIVGETPDTILFNDGSEKLNISKSLILSIIPDVV